MRQITGRVGIGIAIWLACSALVHFYFTGFGFPEPLKLASLHLMLAVPPIFLLYPARPGSPQTRPSALDWMLAIASFLPSLYIYLDPGRVYDRSPYIDPIDERGARARNRMVVLVLEAVRRALSIALSLLAGVVIALHVRVRYAAQRLVLS